MDLIVVLIYQKEIVYLVLFEKLWFYQTDYCQDSFLWSLLQDVMLGRLKEEYVLPLGGGKIREPCHQMQIV